MNSPIKWVGGKSKLAPKLINMFPRHEGFVEVFGGSASVLFAKTRVKWEVLNDFNSDLMNFWKVVKEQNKEFIDSFDYILVSRELFNEYKAIYKSGTYTDPIQRAHIFYYLVKAGFASDMKDPCFGTGKDNSRLRIEAIPTDIKAAYNRLKSTTIENDSFENIIPRYDSPKTFFFIDPPYRDTKEYSVGKFTDEHYELLRDTCKSMKGKFMITINNDELIRELFKDFTIIDHSVFYSVSKKEDSRRKFDELIITNYNTLNI